jgi:hypothetical protein
LRKNSQDPNETRSSKGGVKHHPEMSGNLRKHPVLPALARMEVI